MTKLLLSVGYDSPKLDFGALLATVPEARVARPGPQRRVQVELPEARQDALRAALPEGVRIEALTSYRPMGAAARP